MKNRTEYFIGLIGFLLIALATWSFYNLMNQAVSDLLLAWGIENFYLQNGIIFGLVFVVLILFGSGVFKAIDKIIGRR